MHRENRPRLIWLWCLLLILGIIGMLSSPLIDVQNALFQFVLFIISLAFTVTSAIILLQIYDDYYS